MAKYMLLEVGLHGIDLAHEEVIQRVKLAVDTEFSLDYEGDVEVECIEHAGEDAEVG